MSLQVDLGNGLDAEEVGAGDAQGGAALLWNAQPLLQVLCTAQVELVQVALVHCVHSQVVAESRQDVPRVDSYLELPPDTGDVQVLQLPDKLLLEEDKVFVGCSCKSPGHQWICGGRLIESLTRHFHPCSDL